MNKLFLIFRHSEKGKPKSRPLSQSTPQESKESPRMSVRGTVGKVKIMDKLGFFMVICGKIIYFNFIQFDILIVKNKMNNNK